MIVQNQIGSGGYAKGDVIAAENMEIVTSRTFENALSPYYLETDTWKDLSSVYNDAFPSGLSSCSCTGSSDMAYIRENSFFYAYKGSGNDVIIYKFSVNTDKVYPVFSKTVSSSFDEKITAIIEDESIEDDFFIVTQNHLEKINAIDGSVKWSVTKEELLPYDSSDLDAVWQYDKVNNFLYMAYRVTLSGSEQNMNIYLCKINPESGVLVSNVYVGKSREGVLSIAYISSGIAVAFRDESYYGYVHFYTLDLKLITRQRLSQNSKAGNNISCKKTKNHIYVLDQSGSSSYTFYVFDSSFSNTFSKGIQGSFAYPVEPNSEVNYITRISNGYCLVEEYKSEDTFYSKNIYFTGQNNVSLFVYNLNQDVLYFMGGKSFGNPSLMALVCDTPFKFKVSEVSK